MSDFLQAGKFAAAALGVTSLEAGHHLHLKLDPWFPIALEQQGLDLDVAKRLHEGFAKTLFSHQKQREFNSENMLTWFPQHELPLTKGGRLKSRVKLTRGLLPIWQDDGNTFVLSDYWPLWFSPIAAHALPINSDDSAVLLWLTGDESCAKEAIQKAIPRTIEECYPANQYDALLCAMARLGDLTSKVFLFGYHYKWVATNKHFRQIAGTLNSIYVTDKMLNFWKEFSSKMLPTKHVNKEGEIYYKADPVRGLVAKNIVEGRPVYEGFGNLVTADNMPLLKRGSTALLETMGI